MTALGVTLDAVIVAVTDDTPRILLVGRGPLPSLPTGPLLPGGDETLTLGLRRVVSEQAGVDVTYVEQLYTFGDLDRSVAASRRDLSIGYVALAGETATDADARWVDVYDLFPWEDHRSGVPRLLTDHLGPLLDDWVGDDATRAARERITFGAGAPWDPIRVLERYELLYEAGLVGEAGSNDPSTGLQLHGDHRRIAATALGRLRGKLTYRPVIFEVLPELFTLTHLQTTVEAIIGIRLHKQNFRRNVERNDLVEPTGEMTTATGGRPAELFRFRSEVVSQKPRPGFPLPRPRTL
jgi:hypothetical protein